MLRRALWVLPFAYMLLVWKLSGQPSNAYVELPNSAIDHFLKESLHLVEFAILYLLFVLAAYFNKQLTRGTNLAFAVISCVYGITDEIHQSFFPYRSATYIDAIKDIIGVTIAYYITRIKL